MRYFEKMCGTGKCPPAVGMAETFWSWLGSFLGIAAVSLIHFNLLDDGDTVMLIGSFGASAVLVYGAIQSPLAQPRNLLGGHVISALVGAGCAHLLAGEPSWLIAALAVSLAIAAMHCTRTLHPPGGATALIAVIGGPKIHALGYWYALAPAGLGAAVMLIIALLVNNIPSSRRYPSHWW